MAGDDKSEKINSFIKQNVIFIIMLSDVLYTLCNIVCKLPERKRAVQ